MPNTFGCVCKLVCAGMFVNFFNKNILKVKKSQAQNKYTVEPRYPDTFRTRKKCRHKRSVAVTGVGETHV